MADEAERKTLHQKLHDLLMQRYGLDWRHNLSVSCRIDILSWVVFLAEYGLAKKREEFRSIPIEKREAAAIASLASWELDLEAFVKGIENGTVTPPSPRKRKKGK